MRIGGIYALERVASDSARDHPTVMEVLTAFIREHSHDQWPPSDDPASRAQQRSTRPDVQAALTVVGRRDQHRDIRSIYLDGADLTRADLSNANLRKTFLERANLTDAILGGAGLSEAYLAHANLTRAWLAGANLAGANLTEANAAGAWLAGADLDGAMWPADTPVPEGWRLNPRSFRLERAGDGSEPTQAD